jgi:allantoicase
MALLKSIEIRNTGLHASYWRLTHVQLDHDAGVVEFRLHGYPDHEAREAGKAPLPVIDYRLDADQLNASNLHSITTGQLYAAARALPATDGTVWLAEAEDC